MAATCESTCIVEAAPLPPPPPLLVLSVGAGGESEALDAALDDDIRPDRVRATMGGGADEACAICTRSSCTCRFGRNTVTATVRESDCAEDDSTERTMPSSTGEKRVSVGGLLNGSSTTNQTSTPVTISIGAQPALGASASAEVEVAIAIAIQCHCHANESESESNQIAIAIAIHRNRNDSHRIRIAISRVVDVVTGAGAGAGVVSVSGVL
jgi:hypothetical protein